MNGEKLPEDVSAWDWLFRDPDKASSDQEGSPGMEGTEGLPGEEGSSGQEGSGEPQVRKDEARPEPHPRPAEWGPAEVVVPGRAPVEPPTPVHPREASPVGVPVVRRDHRGEAYRESWRRAVMAAVILGPPKAARGRFRPW
ncbi:hypothetical protein [Kyrpidia tusciae]|uniref:Uncharacterized protein n=1 Tax=Kyrpidia tusciae (strain DSM 2912 / NBRC 15312 / T2) TaxID=562970 RepID=D5WVB7_KYRT2|nr:hypothetical protein [Kyrpidia tusciae]ADG05527.1 hypothetical protein Btus_0768 [Kyrpidia tusciae DSM 2912]